MYLGPQITYTYQRWLRFCTQLSFRILVSLVFTIFFYRTFVQLFVCTLKLCKVDPRGIVFQSAFEYKFKVEAPNGNKSGHYSEGKLKLYARHTSNKVAGNFELLTLTSRNQPSQAITETKITITIDYSSTIKHQSEERIHEFGMAKGSIIYYRNKFIHLE